MKIYIIGPILPFRSGIARHTTAIARELSGRKDVELSVVSFVRQYPRFLYPGAEDVEPDVNPPSEFAVDFCLDSLNPLSWGKTARRVKLEAPDLVLIPSWTFFLSPCLGMIARSLRRGGVPVVMVVHNAFDHEAAPWKTALSRFQLRQATRFVTHNVSIARDLEKLVRGRPITIRPHPVFDDYPLAQGTLPREAKLELLFFGLIRAYKGLDIALRGLARARLENVRLSIVGEFWEEHAKTEALIRELRLEDKVEVVARYVSDQEAAEYFDRCDAVLVPYHSATGSGVVALAYWYGRPVIASDVPGLTEAVSDGETGWIFPVGDEAALARVLTERITRERAAAMYPALAKAKRELSWDRFVDAILAPADGRPSG